MEIMILIAVLCFLCVFILLIANLAALANCCGKLRSLNRRLDRFELQWLLHPPPPARRRNGGSRSRECRNRPPVRRCPFRSLPGRLRR